MSEDVAIKELEEFTKLPDFNNLEGQGGSFLVVPLDKYKVFSKEKFTEDQKMFANAAMEYAVNRMKPLKDELKDLNKNLTLEIIKELGEMGFLGVDVPEEYGGSDLDKTTAAIVVDYLAFSECSSILVRTFSRYDSLIASLSSRPGAIGIKITKLSQFSGADFKSVIEETVT